MTVALAERPEVAPPPRHQALVAQGVIFVITAAVACALHAGVLAVHREEPRMAWLAATLSALALAAVAVAGSAAIERSRRRLRRVERLATAGALAASIAHEIKNPMGIILSATQVLARSPTLPPADRSLLREIEEEVRRADDQLNAFLDLVRDMPLKRAQCDLGDMARSTIELLAAQARQAGVALTADLPSEPLTILGDRRRLRQAVINLVLNAIEACAGRGARTVRVSVGGDELPEDACLTIADDGPGIPRHLLRHACEPFWTTKPNGTGLGLSTAKRIVERHLGRLELESRPGLGTTVTMHLPRNAPGASGVHHLRMTRRGA
ncbi:MAG TPA: ATP-binding protein [Planctomycetota bacterium]|nr:ATP-binding protein [Planctomycetota bacterium]